MTSWYRDILESLMVALQVHGTDKETPSVPEMYQKYFQNISLKFVFLHFSLCMTQTRYNVF